MAVYNQSNICKDLEVIVMELGILAANLVRLFELIDNESAARNCLLLLLFELIAGHSIEHVHEGGHKSDQNIQRLGEELGPLQLVRLL